MPRNLHPGNTSRTQGTRILPRRRVHHREARAGARNTHTHTQGTLRGRNTRQDIHIHHVRTHHAPEPHRLQRVPRRHLQELRKQLHTLRRERLCRHRSRRVRPFVPLAAPVDDSNHRHRPRPPRHLRHKRSLSRKLPALHHTHTARRSTHHTPQPGNETGCAGGRESVRIQPRRRRLPCRQRENRQRRDNIRLRFAHRNSKRHRAGTTRPHQYRERRGGNGNGTARRMQRRRTALRHEDIPGRGASLRLQNQERPPCAALRLRTPPERNLPEREKHTRTLQEPPHNGDIPAAPLHPYARLLQGLRRRTEPARRGDTVRHLPRTRATHTRSDLETHLRQSR